MSSRHLSPALFLGIFLVLTSPTGAAERLTCRPRPPVPAVQRLAVGEAVRTASGQRRRLALPDGSVLSVNEQTILQLTAARRLKLSAGAVFLEAAAAETPFVVETPKRALSAQGTSFAVRASKDGTGVLVVRGQVKVSGIDRPLSAGQQLAPDGDKPKSAPRPERLVAWTRALMASAEAPLVPASPHAGGSLSALDANGQEAKLSLRKYHVDVYIEDGFARTTIDQTYFNAQPARLEGTFRFPLPADASLSRLAMYVDGTRMEGGMVERDYGRNVYESIVERQKDPALLEWVDGTTFKMRVFPLEPRQEKRIVLSYTQKLPTLYGQAAYRFPAGHSLGKVGAWSFHARVKGRATLSWSSPSHGLNASRDKGDLLLDASEKDARLDRDVVLTLGSGDGALESARFSSMEQDGVKYLMVRYRPGLPAAAPRQRRDWVFLFEASGDRDPLLARAQVEVVRALLHNADPDDTFAVLAAGTRVRLLAKQPQPVTPQGVQAAIAFLEDAHLIGALDQGRAFAEALPLLKAGKDPYLVHVGSGIAAMGEQRQDELVKRIPEGTRYVGIGVGKRWDRAFMKTAAERSGGHFTQINPDEEISWRAFELASTLNASRLLGVNVSDSGKNRYLTFSSLVAQGEEVCAVTRLDGKELPKTLTVRGTFGGQRFERELAVKDVADGAGYLPRTWAKLEIERLLAEDAVKHKERIVALSKAMVVMTPFTSLLVLENEAMYQQYKVDRGRTDHWARYACPDKVAVFYEDEDGTRIDPRKTVKSTPRQVLATVLSRNSSSDQQGISVSVEGFPNGTMGLRSEEYAVTGKPLPMGGVAGLDFRRAILSPLRLQTAQAVVTKSMADPNLIVDNTNTKQNSTLRLDPLPRFESSQPRNLLRIFERGGKFLTDIGVPDIDEAPNRPIASKLSVRGLGTQNRTDPVMIGLQKKRLFTRDASVHKGTARVQALLNQSEDLRQIPNEWARFWYTDQPPQRTYDRVRGGVESGPSSQVEDRLFFDLIAYAPGMNTSRADVLAVLEAESLPSTLIKLGKIDEGARRLLDKARPDGWQTLQLPGEGNGSALTITFDGRGRYAYEHLLPPGIREQVVCDGKTLLHLYPDFGIGARRAVSRFHRLDFARLVPWALPHAEDLARGADLKVVGERTVAVVPHGVEAIKDKEGKAVPYAIVQFVFAADGRLAEQRVVEMPTGKVLSRLLLGTDGTLTVLGEKDRQLSIRKGKLSEGKAPNLTPAVKKLVVLALPYRSRAHVLETRKLKDKAYGVMRFEDALDLFASDVAAGNGDEALKVFREGFHNRDQRQLGFYVLLAACGQNLDSQNVDVLAEHADEPLAQYLALYSSPVLRAHASQWAAGSGQWGDGFLRHLSVTHALLQRWQNARALGSTPVRRQAALQRAVAYIRQHKGTAFAWALLTLIQDRTNEDEANQKDIRGVHRSLTELWPLFDGVSGLGDAARYEQARSLWKSGQREQARQCFADLYEKTLKQDALLLFDADFRQTLQGDGQEKDLWSPLMRKTARKLIADKRRPAVLALVQQCRQVEDSALANDLLTLALDGVTDKKERLRLTTAAVESLIGAGQLIEADRLLQPLLADAALSKRAAPWRLAAAIARARDLRARELECLERALAAEYRELPEVINVKRVEEDYGKVMDHYRQLADAMVTLKVEPPADFLAKVVRTADRWRSLSDDGTAACTAAAAILRQLGDSALAWDYLTTPVGLRPRESAPWAALAETLRRQGDLALADQALASAVAAEPTNAQLLWDRARNLKLAGRRAESRKLLRQLVEGSWQPRFQPLQKQARWQLDNR